MYFAKAVLLVLLMLSLPLGGCFGNEESELKPQLVIDETANPTIATRGQIYTLTVQSNVEWTVNRSDGAFFVDEFGVFRDGLNITMPANISTLEILILDTELSTIDLGVSAGGLTWNTTLELQDSTDMMLVDGRRAFDTIDMLTTSHNNRWCASASVHDGGANFLAAAEAIFLDTKDGGRNGDS